MAKNRHLEFRKSFYVEGILRNRLELGIVSVDRVFGDIDFSIKFIDGRRVFRQIVQAKIDVYANPPIEKTLWKPFDLLERKPPPVAGMLVVDLSAECPCRRQH
jgi:hypothetical protein